MKRKLLGTMLAVVLFAIFSVSASAFIIGDPDNDFLVTVADARYTLRLSVGLESCEKESDQYKASDANGDGTVTTGDARTILRVAVGLETFPDHTESNQNIRITKMPYTTNGLVINSIQLQDDYFHLNITNKTSKTDMAVKGTSRIPYKMYNAQGDVIYSSNVYVAQMNYNESCNVKFLNKAGTVKLVFGSATVDFTEAVVVTETEVLNGITVSKAPYTVKGLKVSKTVIDAEKRKISFYVTNTTGAPASGSIKFATYDAKGNSLDIISASVPSLNNGEKVIAYTYYDEGTAKIIFNAANCNSSAEFKNLSTQYENRDSISMSKLPLTIQGITIDFHSIKYSYGGTPILYLKITNKTGKTIDSTESAFYVKGFDAEGYLDELSKVRIPKLDNNESSIEEVYLTEATKKVDLGNLTVKTTATTQKPGATTVIDGVTTNATKDSFSGIVFSDFVVEKGSSYANISFKITNKTGKTITNYTTFSYKALSTDNLVLATGTFYVSYTLNNNEYMHKEISLDSAEVGAFYIFLQELEEGTPIKDSAAYMNVGAYSVTKPPFVSNGLEILSYRTEGDYLYVRIKNNTDKSVMDYSHFNYRVHGTDGAVVKESSVYCNQMNAGETCEVKIYLLDTFKKITFTDAEIYN